MVAAPDAAGGLSASRAPKRKVAPSRFRWNFRNARLFVSSMLKPRGFGTSSFGSSVALALTACSGPQSALDPAGEGAEQIAGLFWIMAGGGALIWLLVIGAVIYATRIAPGPHSERVGDALLLWGGLVVPTVVLGGLLTWGLALMVDLRAPGDGLKIAVSGEQWWWRVAYHLPGREAPVRSANEIRLPRGERVEFELTSPDVIHAFWIPSIAGKMDMIPGRTNRLVVQATRTGTFRGACAEYCGTSHALMAFSVEVMEPAAFEQWLAQEAAGADPPATALAAQGQELFEQVGCGGCHAVRGTAAEGTIGPDLTHLAGRATLAAGILPNDREALVRWITQTEMIKPDSRMPSFGALPEDHVEAIAAYLEGLE
jgi:cytochrome c oxidase subunit II